METSPCIPNPASLPALLPVPPTPHQFLLLLLLLLCQVRINYANPDMVGHTGDLEASKRACATVDKCVADLLAVLDEVNGR